MEMLPGRTDVACSAVCHAPAAATSCGERRVVVVSGPTAVGKSVLALALCERLGGEIISVDSVQVYRGLQIGSNKASEQERARVPHHMLDLREPTEEYSAGRFYVDALHCIRDVLQKGRVPVVVGGTSMYMRWLVRGRPQAPKADPAISESVREALAPYEAADDWAGGHALLAEMDPKRAAQLSRNDCAPVTRRVFIASFGITCCESTHCPPPLDMWPEPRTTPRQGSACTGPLSSRGRRAERPRSCRHKTMSTAWTSCAPRWTCAACSYARLAWHFATASTSAARRCWSQAPPPPLSPLSPLAVPSPHTQASSHSHRAPAAAWQGCSRRWPSCC